VIIMLKRISVLFCMFFAALTVASAQTSTTIHVAAAANLQTVLTTKIIPAFEAQSSVTVVPTFGATKVLEQQEENGAPFDVFISADTATVKKLADDGIIDKASVTPYAVGALVVWTSASTGLTIKALSDLTDAKIQHIGIANPKTAPYGAAAIDTLTSANLLDTLLPKIVYAENIQQALQYAVTGNADVSFTALSLVISRTDGSYFVVPDSQHKPIVQSLGVALNASAAAKQFASFLTSKAVDQIWTTSGYRLP
jgi:molybdate transport system substrate-binding protein